MTVSHSQEARLNELIVKYECKHGTPMNTAELQELRYLAVQAYKEQRNQLAMMRGV